MSESTAKKLYVAGPMRGYENFNFPAFDDAAAHLRAAGYEVFNPAERDRSVHGDLRSATGNLDDIADAGFSMRDALAADTAWICRHADGIAVLPRWESSAGAQAEVSLGRALGLPVNSIDHWAAAVVR